MPDTTIKKETIKTVIANNAKVSAVEVLNIYGKPLKYIVVETDKDKVIVNVGEKTFDKIKSLTA